MRSQWHQLNHIQAICTSLQKITTPAPHQSDFYGPGCPSWHPTNSVKALKADPEQLIILIWIVSDISVLLWDLCSGRRWKDEYVRARRITRCWHLSASSLVVIRLHGIKHYVNVRMQFGRYDTRAHHARHGRVTQLPTCRARRTQLLVASSQAAPTQNCRPACNVVSQLISPSLATLANHLVTK